MPPETESKYPVCAPLLPSYAQRVLFGDRAHGIQYFDPHDADWLEWQKHYLTFYNNTQKTGVGSVVNNAGYRVLSTIDFTGLRCLEIGPGILPHRAYWRGSPACYDIADIQQAMLDGSRAILEQNCIPTKEYLLPSDRKEVTIPAQDASYDCIITFYSLEHIHPLHEHLLEYKRLLRPGGLLMGAIPTEGGLAWGVGRVLTSRRYIKKNFNFDFDKITAWEHCNTAQDILRTCDRMFTQEHCDFWPLRIPLTDINLVIRFRYRHLL